METKGKREVLLLKIFCKLLKIFKGWILETIIFFQAMLIINYLDIHFNSQIMGQMKKKSYEQVANEIYSCNWFHLSGFD